jgi:hypothetical protein
VISAVTIVACAGGLLGCVAFVVGYHWRTGGRWRASEVGKLLMLANLDLALILALILSNRLLGDWPGRREATAVLVAAFMVQPWWWLRLLWHAQANSPR